MALRLTSQSKVFPLFSGIAKHLAQIVNGIDRAKKHTRKGQPPV